MIERIQPYNLNSKSLLYIKQTSGSKNQNKEKTLYQIIDGGQSNKKSKISPLIKVSSRNNGEVYSYNNLSTLDIVTAQKSKFEDRYTVSIPSKKGNKIIGYVKENTPIAWTKDKNAVKLLKKIGLVIKNGI